MRIFFSAGEPSGDMHGANLIRALRAQHSDFEAVGFGGPEMSAAGCQLEADLTALAVMWLLRALLNLHKFLALLGKADRYFRQHRPDAVVLIDYPGFNWWIARRAKAHGIPVFYYAPPQVWAWASWRIRKMRRYVDHVLASMPFEARWFSERGCRATFVGHPYFDEVRRQELDAEFLMDHADPDRPLVVLLPGSRDQEIDNNLEMMLEAARRIAAQVPQARFAVASFKVSQARTCREMAADKGLDIDVFARRTPELIHLADCCLAVSGSVSLELLYHAKPTVIVYRVGRFAYRVQSWFRKVKFITLVNLLACENLYSDDSTPYDPNGPGAEQALFPEYLTCEEKSAQIANHLVGWLTDRASRARLVERLQALKHTVAYGGASTKAASYILVELAKRPTPMRRPHFLPATQVSAATGDRPAQDAA